MKGRWWGLGRDHGAIKRRMCGLGKDHGHGSQGRWWAGGYVVPLSVISDVMEKVKVEPKKVRVDPSSDLNVK